MKRSLFTLLFAAVIGAALSLGASVADAKGGRGGGFGGGHGFKSFKVQSAPPGWSRGKKVGWRGRGCPPGLWKQGRC